VASVLLALLMATSLMPSAALAQRSITETTFSGWTTSAAAGFSFSDVSGEQVSDGSDGHYLVRHQHRKEDPLRDNLGNCCVQSLALSPRSLDPSLLGAEGPYEIGVDVGYEVDPGYFPGNVGLVWSPVVEQAGELFSFRPVGGGAQNLVPLGGPYRREIVYFDWNGRAPDLVAGAPRIRLGLQLATTAFPWTAPQVEARVTVDNLVVEAGGELPPLTVSFLGTYPPDSTYGSGLRRVFAIGKEEDTSGAILVTRVGLNRSAAQGNVAVVFPSSDWMDEDQQNSPAILDLATRNEWQLRRDRPSTPPEDVPGTLRLIIDGSSEVQLGEPNEVEVWFLPCRVLVAGTSTPCHGCIFDVFDAFLHLGVDSVRTSPTAASAGAVAESDAVLRGFRDQRMAASPAGRYYRDLYEILSPDLILTLVPRAGLVGTIAAAEPPWITALEAATAGDGDEISITQKMVDDMLDIFDTFASGSDERVQKIFRFERERLRLEELPGLSIEDAIDLVAQRGGPPPCVNDELTLCLGDGRFRVEVFWRDFEGGTGDGRATPLSGDSGTFWFFHEDNIELVIKVLDATAIYDRFWVFYGALSNVEFTITVTDTVTGAIRAYHNRAGELASAGDSDAFTPDGNRPADSAPALRSPAGVLEALADASGDLLRRGWRRTRTVFGDRDARLLGQRLSLSVATAPDLAGTSCGAGASALCLNGGRFRVQVAWRDFGGGRGVGMPRPLSADTGTFWFFDEANTELIVKVLDGTPINDHFWVFYGALSNVEYTITITDTVTGAVRTYDNPLGEFGSAGDTEAF
jgi:hypothetical protein